MAGSSRLKRPARPWSIIPTRTRVRLCFARRAAKPLRGASMATRREKDSLGTMDVPADALYGAQTQRAVLNFPISGLKQYRAFIWPMALIKRAAAEVNM